MAKEDDNFITKHAARFNLNPSERTSSFQNPFIDFYSFNNTIFL